MSQNKVHYSHIVAMFYVCFMQNGMYGTRVLQASFYLQSTAKPAYEFGHEQVIASTQK